MYKLVKEDITAAGGPMGFVGDGVFNLWTKYFHSEQAAKRYAENDFDKPFKWRKVGTGVTSSGDLLYCMYTLTNLRMEDQ